MSAGSYNHEVHFQNVEKAITRVLDHEKMRGFGDTEISVTLKIPFEYDQFIREMQADNRSDGRVRAVLQDMIRHRILEIAAEIKGNRQSHLYTQFLQEPFEDEEG